MGGENMSLIACSPQGQMDRRDQPFCGTSSDWKRERIEKEKFMQMKAQKTNNIKQSKLRDERMDVHLRRKRVSNGALIQQSKRSKQKKKQRKSKRRNSKKQKRMSRKRGSTQYAVPDNVDILSSDDEDINHRLNLMNNPKTRCLHKRDDGVTSLPIPRQKKYVIRLTSTSLKDYELTKMGGKEAPICEQNLFETEDEETTEYEEEEESVPDPLDYSEDEFD